MFKHKREGNNPLNAAMSRREKAAMELEKLANPGYKQEDKTNFMKIVKLGSYDDLIVRYNDMKIDLEV